MFYCADTLHLHMLVFLDAYFSNIFTIRNVTAKTIPEELPAFAVAVHTSHSSFTYISKDNSTVTSEITVMQM